MTQENNTIEAVSFETLIIYQRNNNIDEKDNLDDLPKEKAVYGISGRINDRAANFRYVGITNNLQAAVKEHFSSKEPDQCLKTFMQSIKIKSLTYRLLNNQNEKEMAEALQEWKSLYKPECNDKLNEVF